MSGREYKHVKYETWLKRGTIAQKDMFYATISRNEDGFKLEIDLGTSSHLLLMAMSGPYQTTFAEFKKALNVAKEFKEFVPNTVIYVIREAG